MKKSIFLTACLAMLVTLASAQIKTPQPSPTAKVSQEVGLTKVDLEFSRPSAKGRKIFGDLVPFGELWRTGANASSKITFGEDVKVGGTSVPKGTYALYTTPGERQWEVVFYKNTTYWGTPEPAEYKMDDIAAKVTVPAVALKDAVESLTIAIDNLKNNGADVVISWENTKVAVPFTLDTDSKVMADIKTQMEGPSANTYYSAARYYFEENKDLKQALAWVDQSLAKGGDKFWILRLKANIQAGLGMYKDAIATAEKSSDLAKKEGNADYQRMNAKSIEEWKMKK
jgi:tetratricopeptide (TPR) repeat protein